MRKILLVLLPILLLGLAMDTYGQLNRRHIKKNNRRMMHYKGKKFGFSKEKRYNSVGVSISALNYYGDLAPKPSRLSTDISFTRPALGVSFSHRFGPRYTFLAGFTYGTLSGSDAESADQNDSENGVFRYKRNLSFRNRIKELSALAILDLFENQSTYISRVQWTPYAYLGVSVFHHNPKAKVPQTDLFGNAFANAGEWVELQPLGTEGQFLDLPPGHPNEGIKPYKRIQIAIPFGIGFRLRLNEIMDLSGEMGFRYLFTDYIDDVSQNYVYVGAFGNDELAKAMSYRTNEVVTPGPADLLGYSDPKYSDTRTYNLIAGYGHENGPGIPLNNRGDKDKDIFTVFTVRYSYIIGKTFHRAKFR